MPPEAQDFKPKDMINKKLQPESENELAQSIEDEMRAQMLLKDPKMLEDYLHAGFDMILEKMPEAAKAIQERAARMKSVVEPVEALVQETRLRLTALGKSVPEQVSDTSKVVKIMTDQLRKRAGTLKETEKQGVDTETRGSLQKLIWDMMMEQAHQSKKE